MGTQSAWARDWLRSVAEARLAIERARKLVEVRRERALCMGNPMGGGTGADGTNRSEENVLALLESEDDLATTYAWATKELREFDEMAKANRQCLRGAMLDGLDVAEMKYRIGMSDREAAKALGISRSKLHADLGAFVDYLDFIGRERAMSPPVESRLETTRPSTGVAPARDGPGHGGRLAATRHRAGVPERHPLRGSSSGRHVV